MKLHWPPVATVTRPVPHQVKAMAGITQALRNAGVTVRETFDRTPPESIVFVWSLKWAREIWAKHPETLICVCDHGIFHPRNKTVVTGWMSLNGWGSHPVVDDGGERLVRKGWDKVIRPFRASNRWSPHKPVAVVMGQCYNDVQILGQFKDYGEWLTQIAEELTNSGYDVRFRPHPVQARNDLDRYPRIGPILQGPLEASLEHATTVVGYNSNSLLDALMLGIEDVRIYNNGSWLWPISYQTRHGYRSVEPTARLRLANRLAYCQWDPEEIADGEWLRYHAPIVEQLLAGNEPIKWYETEVPDNDSAD